MIIYNETFILEDTVEQEWLAWMKEVQIPAIMATGYFSSYQILTIIDSPNEGITYCVQYMADTIEQFQDYYSGHLFRFQDGHQQQFAERFVLFNTVMKTVD
ncbi:DUF4286 family protein [Mucilaginibacter psychrotolerans]|uniref:DUF4286 family protein n=1 Tax=Mucilaginibacter psychrotolerans TaxID=1524096 RepID=A0A4Y8S4V0_9SPHI|nr:DUF4286 family protein [Mucilaginibacter psychrotolerans]TFF33932.1 DUF4286 family protein [Mucilaginibacter psychrotolerans]